MRTENYFHDNYGLTLPHSELRSAAPRLTPNSQVLDLGCGNGRNSLYLADAGHQVQAWDKNVASIENLQRIARQEKLNNLDAAVADLNQVNFHGAYDLLLSTVVMMFLEPAAIPRLINQMQEATRPGGLNLIVSAMSTADFPCSVGFPFTFKEGELAGYYAGWDLHKYNEDVGELHKTDSNGNRIKLRFATLLAQKV